MIKNILTDEQRYRGAMVGLGTGDALGLPYEFVDIPEDLDKLEMIDNKKRGIKAGYWSDDMSMALCLAESLFETKRFKPHDQMKRYLLWIVDGYLTPASKSFGSGGTTREALGMYLRKGQAYSGSTKKDKAGNGSIMRLAPVPLFFLNKPHKAINLSGESSRTTHQAVECIHACRYFGSLMTGALRGIKKNDLLADCYDASGQFLEMFPLCEKVSEIAYGSFKEVIWEHGPSAYVVETLTAALQSFWKTDTFEEGLTYAIKLGGDADTVGAVYGQLAGAYYGIDSIPERWLGQLSKKELIVEYADKLLAARLK